MTTQDTIALAATIRDEAERLENQHLGQSGFTTHTMRCQTLYLKLCAQAAGEALPDARVIAAALKVTEALGETDVTKIRVPSVLALALLNLERVVSDACPSFDGKRCSCEPAVREMSATIADLRDRLKLLAPYVCKRCGCAPVEIVTCYGNLESTEFCDDCESVLVVEGFATEEEAAMSVSRFCRAVAGRRLIP